MSLAALIFDLDGTLVDSDPYHLRAFREMGARTGIDVDEEYFLQHISGRSNGEICAGLWPAASEDEHLRLSAEKETLFRSMLGDISPISGLRALLDWAKHRGLSMAVVSNAPKVNILAITEALGITDCFSALISGEDLGRGKPDPLPYLAALERLNVPASHAVAFEDASAGIRAAVAAEIPTVGIATTQTHEFLRDAGAILSVGDFSDARLQAYLEKRAE